MCKFTFRYSRLRSSPKLCVNFPSSIRQGLFPDSKPEAYDQPLAAALTAAAENMRVTLLLPPRFMRPWDIIFQDNFCVIRLSATAVGNLFHEYQSGPKSISHPFMARPKPAELKIIFRIFHMKALPSPGSDSSA